MMNETILGRHIQVNLAPSDEHSRQGIMIPKMCHGDRIVDIQTGAEDLSSCDALVTKRKDVSLGIATADCAPICYADNEQVGIAHVGWRGLCLGLAEKTLSQFSDTDTEVYVGPHMHVFEIKKDFCYDAVIKKFGETFLTHEEGRTLFHFRDALTSLLPKSTTFDDRNTFETLDFPSFRRDATTTRLLTVVQWK